MGEQHKTGLAYIPALDGLRAVSILAVMLFHAHILPGGYVGVDIFFVISGYLITKLLVQEYERFRKISFVNFYVRRGLRILPALWFFLSFYLLAVLVLSHNPIHREKQFLAFIFSLTFTMNWIRAYWPNYQDIIGHLWSLAVEEQFYLIWPACLFSLLKYQRKRVVHAVCLAIFAIVVWKICLWVNGATYERLYNGFDTRADEPLFGCLIALIGKDLSTFLLRHYWIPICLISATLWSGFGNAEFMYFGGQTIFAAACAWLVTALVYGNRNIAVLILSNRPLTLIGKLSYGLYLWHPAPIISLRQNHLPIWVAFITAILAAVFSYYFIELPFLKRKDNLTKAKSSVIREHSVTS